MLAATLRGRVANSPLGELAVTHPHARPLSDGHATALVRPEQVRLGAPVGDGPTAVVDEVAFFGGHASVTLRQPGGLAVVARVPATMAPSVGARVGIEVVGTVVVFQ
jgi:iron(III) transport system ATP-binding protein